MDKSKNTPNAGLSLELFLVNYKKIHLYWKSAVLSDTFWCLYWNSCAGAGVVLDGKKLPLLPQNLYLVPPGTNLHTWCDDPQAEQLYLHFYLHGVHSPEKLLTLPLSAEWSCWKDRLLEKIRSNAPELFFAGAQLVTSVFAALPEAALIRAGDDEVMNRIAAFMRRNLGRNLSVTALARDFKLTEAELSKRFFKSYGKTPYSYFSALRVERAAMMLRNSAAPMEEIARLCGFADRDYFSRVFKKHTGISPAAYRRSSRN